MGINKHIIIGLVFIFFEPLPPSSADVLEEKTNIRKRQNGRPLSTNGLPFNIIYIYGLTVISLTL